MKPGINPRGFAAALTLVFAACRAAAASDVALDEHFQPVLPSIPDRTVLVTDFGAVGDGKTLNTGAFAAAVAHLSQEGGGRLEVPKGVFRTLSFALCSNLDLHLDEGAVIQAPDSFEGYGLPDPSTFRSQAEVNEKVTVPQPLITGTHLHDVAITGPGAIDGNGAIWWAWSERASRAHPGRLVYRRYHLVVINGCERLHVSDVTLRNSPMFHLVLRAITDLVIERVKVRAPFNAPNTDAIDPGPVVNAVIRDCDLDTGDDDIAIKSGGTNVLIENCTIKHGHGISIGSEITRGVHNMLVRDCSLTGTDNGIRIKSMRGAGGPVDHVRYSNIRMEGVTNAIVLQLDYVDDNRPDFRGDPSKVPSIRDIVFEHIAILDSKNAGKIIGLPDSPIEGIVMRDVHISAQHGLVIKDAKPIVYEDSSGR
jgi:polygalacturonase